MAAVGDGGHLHSIERRDDFAGIARANVESFFEGPHPAWTLTVGDLSDVLPVTEQPGSVDRVVLDMLAPWENLAAVADALAPGGVLVAYVASTTQLSRLAEDVRDDGRFTEPQAWESLVRGWHLEGLAVRPEHRMVGHTGFLLSTRRMAEGVEPPLRRRRPAKGAYPDADDWNEDDLGERPVSDKKVRRLRRQPAHLLVRHRTLAEVVLVPVVRVGVSTLGRPPTPQRGLDPLGHPAGAQQEPGVPDHPVLRAHRQALEVPPADQGLPGLRLGEPAVADALAPGGQVLP